MWDDPLDNQAENLTMQQLMQQASPDKGARSGSSQQQQQGSGDMQLQMPSMPGPEAKEEDALLWTQQPGAGCSGSPGMPDALRPDSGLAAGMAASGGAGPGSWADGMDAMAAEWVANNLQSTPAPAATKTPSSAGLEDNLMDLDQAEAFMLGGAGAPPGLAAQQAAQQPDGVAPGVALAQLPRVSLTGGLGMPPNKGEQPPGALQPQATADMLAKGLAPTSWWEAQQLQQLQQQLLPAALHMAWQQHGASPDAQVAAGNPAWRLDQQVLDAAAMQQQHMQLAMGDKLPAHSESEAAPPPQMLQQQHHQQVQPCVATAAERACSFSMCCGSTTALGFLTLC